MNINDWDELGHRTPVDSKDDLLSCHVKSRGPTLTIYKMTESSKNTTEDEQVDQVFRAKNKSEDQVTDHECCSTKVEASETGPALSEVQEDLVTHFHS